MMSSRESYTRPHLALFTVHLARFLSSFFRFHLFAFCFSRARAPSLSFSFSSSFSPPSSSKLLHSARADLVPFPPALYPSLTVHLILSLLHPFRLTLPPLSQLRNASCVHLLRQCTRPALLDNLFHFHFIERQSFSTTFSDFEFSTRSYSFLIAT